LPSELVVCERHDASCTTLPAGQSVTFAPCSGPAGPFTTPEIEPVPFDPGAGATLLLSTSPFREAPVNVSVPVPLQLAFSVHRYVPESCGWSGKVKIVRTLPTRVAVPGALSNPVSCALPLGAMLQVEVPTFSVVCVQLPASRHSAAAAPRCA